MALTERLQIIVTADGKGAAQEFTKIGATAERELGRTDDKLKRLSSGLVSSGTQIALAGGIATAGVFALAKAAGDYEEAASAAGVIFGDSAESIEDFGKAAIDSAGLSRRAAVEAANSFGTFGKAAGLTGDDLASFSTDLTQLAGDLASFKNTSTEEAITAIGAALRGESEPIRRYGVLLDDATLKQEALSLGIYDGTGALSQQQKVLAAQAAIFKQTSDAQGDFARTSDSLSNQTRSFTAEIENLKVGLGEGAVPVFSELVGAANDALGAFQNLSPETQDVVGRIGAIGAVGVTAVGGLSVIAGGVLRLVDTFGSLRGRLTDTQGQLTRTGQIATTAGKVIGGAVAVGGVLLLADALFQLTQNAGNTQQALDRLKIDIPKGNAEQTLSTLNSLGEGYKDLGDALIEPFVGSAVVKTSDEYGVALANIDRAINDLYKSGNIEGARAALEALNEVKLRPDNAAALDDINAVIDRYTPKLNDAETATRDASGAVDTFTGGIDRYRNGVDEAAESTGDFGGELDKINKLTKLSGDLFGLAADRAAGFLGSIEDSSAIDDLLGASLDLRDSSKALLDGVGALAGVDVQQVASGFGDISDEAADALRDVLALGDDAQASIAAALQFQGADAARAKADTIRDGLINMLEAAGLADDQIQYLLESIGLTPEQVNTAITISGTDEAIAKLNLLREFYTNADGTSGIPAEVETQVSIAIAEGRFVDAANLISLWVKDQEDGSIEDPLLIALGLGDTKPLEDDIDTTKRNEEGKPPIELPVDADMSKFYATINAGIQYAIEAGRAAGDAAANGAARLIQPKPKPTYGGFKGGIDPNPGGGVDGNVWTPYANGGFAEAGMPGFANEPSLGGELFVPKTDGFVMNAADTSALIGGIEKLLAGQGAAGGMTVTQTIVTADPLVAGSESARRMRDAQFLAGV